jgi:uncharacterized membrane protein YgcG
MKYKKSISLFVIFTGLFMILSSVFFISSCSSKEEAISDKIDYPAYQTFLNDYTNTLTEEWKTKTLQLVESVEKETTCEIAVAVIDRLNGISIEEYAVGLFNKWGVGKKDKDNGVLLLVAMDDHELKIEVGYGLEGVITDLEAGEIVDNVIVPRFKENDYDSGIYNGVVEIANKIYQEQGKAAVAYADTVKSVPEKGFTDSKAFPIIIALLPWFIFGGIFVVLFLTYYIRTFIRTHKCPKCYKIGLSIKRTILVRPTYKSPGRAEIERKCRYCGFYEKKTSTISRLFKSSGSGTGSSGFSSSSSSSSHSSSSSSSSSFGGGSSGGGGASGKW